MACIVWELPNGEQYLVPEGKAHNPSAGAFNTGVVDWDCAGGTGQHEVDAMLAKAGVPWGSAIKKVTGWIGMKQCTSCKAREIILNHAKEHGWAKTLQLLKETL